MTQSLPSVHRQLDFRGLMCPEPVVRTAQAARQLAAGGMLEIQADDDAFPADLTSWCRSTRSELVSLDEAEGVFRAVVRVPPAGAGGSRAPKPPAPPSPASPMNAPVAAAARAAAPAPVATPVETEEVLDFRGKQCPEPIVLLARAARNAKTKLVVLADDEAFPADVRSWCRSAGAELEDLAHDGTMFRAVVRPRGVQAPVAPIVIEPPPASPAPAAPAQARFDGGETLPAPGQRDVPKSVGSAITLDARTLEGPALLQMLDGMAGMPTGTKVSISLGNAESLQAATRWVSAREHELLAFDPAAGEVRLILRGRPSVAPGSAALVPASQGDVALANPKHHATRFVRDEDAPDCALLVLSDDLEALLAALLVANGAAAQGLNTMVFFTFWGLNLLRGDTENTAAPVEKISFFQRVFKWLMPRGPRKPRLGKLDFGGMGTSILGGIMRTKNIQDLPALLASAEAQGVRFVACTMSMSVMGIGRRDLAPRPNLSFAGVATFVEAARGAAITLKF